MIFHYVLEYTGKLTLGKVSKRVHPTVAGDAEPSSGLLLHKLGSYTSITSGVILNAHIIVV